MTGLDDFDEDRALAAEYALGLLDLDAARAVEERLATEPELRVLVATWQTDLAGMLDGAAPVPPPPSLRAALHRRLFPDESHSLWRRLGILPALLGAAAAAGLAFVVTQFGLPLLPSPVLETQIAAQDQSLVVEARYAAAEGVLHLERAQGQAAPGRALEVWLIAGGGAPVSLGLLAEGTSTQVPLPPTLAAMLEGAVLAISDEPAGGSPTGQPTGAVLATGQIG